MITSDRLRELVGEDRVHRSLYVDPEIFELEMHRVYGRSWVYLCHESEIDEPDSFVQVPVGRRPVLVCRRRDGNIVGLLNRCAHRGVPVCMEESGIRPRFTCSYHGWTYDNEGRLVNVPFMDTSEFENSEWGLIPLAAVDSHRGFVFGVVREPQQSLADHLGDAAALIDEWVDRSPTGEISVTHGARATEARANWKLYLDGAADGLHPFMTHRSYVAMAGRHRDDPYLGQFRKSPDLTGMYSVAYPGGHQFLDQRPGMPDRVWEVTRFLPGRESYLEALASSGRPEEEVAAQLERVTVAGMNVLIFPNLSLVGNSVGVIRPLAVDRTEVHWKATSLAGDDPAALPLRLRICEDFPNFGDTDDQENWERAQHGLTTVPEAEWLSTGRGEARAPGERNNVTSEWPMRGYQAHWLSLMTRD